MSEETDKRKDFFEDVILLAEQYGLTKEEVLEIVSGEIKL